jgi:hypothetical protein
VQLITRYALSMLIENGIADAINFFHLDSLSSMVGLKVDFDLQLTLMAAYSTVSWPKESAGSTGGRRQSPKVILYIETINYENYK